MNLRRVDGRLRLQPLGRDDSELGYLFGLLVRFQLDDAPSDLLANDGDRSDASVDLARVFDVARKSFERFLAE